jgi:hypothetical protein
MIEQLPEHQGRLLERWLPGATLVADLSWGSVGRRVLEIEHEGQRYVVKAGAESDHHIDREVWAHRHWLEPWTSRGRAPVLVEADVEAKILVTRHVPGRLLLNTPHVDDPDAFRQAGELLALRHEQHALSDPLQQRREAERALRYLDGDHRIDPDTEQRLRSVIASWPDEPTVLVPTHGDWQPRNWLVDDGVVRVIDLGRAAMRPAMSDLTRLAAQDFRRDPRLEAAFLDGYGSDPREPDGWLRQRAGEAIGTACWAHQVGDTTFEAQGHRMIAEVLADLCDR